MSPPPLPYETLRAIVEGASDGVFVTDESLRIEWVNETACRLLALPFEAIVGRTIAELLAPEEPIAHAPLRRDDLRAGVPTTTLRTFRTGDGGIRILEVKAKSIGGGRFLGLARDATERLQAERRLARSEASFRALIEASPDGVVVHRDGRVVYASSALATLLRWPSAEAMLGTPVVDLIHEDDRARVSERIASMVAGADGAPFLDQRLVRRDGSVLAASVAGVRVVFEGELSVLAVVRDLTEQRRIHEQLAHADRLASLGTLAAGVAHEINNPLTYVLLHLDALSSLARRAASSSPELAAAIGDHAEPAVEGAQRVARIVRDLRAFSRVDDEMRAAIDVHRPIELAASTAAHELKHRARVERAFTVVPPVAASEGRLAQIVLNLLLNAAQAVPEGRPDENRITLRTSFERGEVRIAVSDTGVGISEEHRRHLFEPFFTTKPVGVGSGLGLAICHGLVTTLGGRIEVESSVGVGSTFTVVLPAAAALLTEPSTEHAGARGSRRARILVVDDEPSIADAIAFALGARHQVACARSGLDARDALARDDAWDLILCDVAMPGLDGPGLLAWIREQRPALAPAVVFMSGGRAGASDALATIEPSRVIEKPFTMAGLEARIDEALARARA